MFTNREEAGRILSKKLRKYKGANPLVLGIPRGAMPMAAIIARELDGELNAILVHKIPAPNQEELAIGSVGLTGDVFRLPSIQAYGISEEYVQKAVQEQRLKLKDRRARLQLPPFNCKNRTVILVDDGIATGATAFGAIHEIRAQKPAKLILAAGVVPASLSSEMRGMVDEFVVLEEPDFFYAVSQFFQDFTQVTDEEVVEIFKQEKFKKRQPQVSQVNEKHP